MDVSSTPTGLRSLPDAYPNAAVHGIAALVVMLLGVLASLCSAPAADAAPVAPAPNSARHGNPGPPTLDFVNGSADRLDIGYYPPKSDGGHKIRRYEATLNGGKTWKKIGRAEDEFGELSGSRKNLTINKRYKVAVRAVNKKGHSKPSRLQTVIPVNPPSKPRDVAVTVADGRVTVNWKAPKHDGGRPIVWYDVVAVTDDELVLGTLCDQPVLATDRSCSFTGLVSGKPYKAHMAAINYMDQPADANPKVTGWSYSDFTTDIPFVAP